MMDGGKSFRLIKANLLSLHGLAYWHGECTAIPLAIVKPRTWLSCKKPFTLQT